jgi:hypothetical protein
MNWKPPDLVRVSGLSRSAVAQWLGKGSKLIKTIGNMEAAEAIEQASGFCALWIATGAGPKRVTAGPMLVAEPTSQYATPSQVLDQLSELLARLPADRRRAVAENLSGLALEGGAYHWRAAALAAMTAEEPVKAPRAA